MAFVFKFKINKIPVSIYPNFLILVLLLSLGRIGTPAFLVSWILVILFSIVLHELGHALAARFFGHEPTIELRGIAGLTYLTKKEGKDNFLSSIIITLAGPLTGIGIGLLFLLLSRMITFNLAALQIIIRDIIWVNLYWSLANLLPALPLDGGNLSRLILTRFFKHRGKLIAYILSALITIPLGIYFLFSGNIYLTLLTAYLTIFNLQMFGFSLKRGADSRFSPEITRGYYLLQNGKPAETIALCRELLTKVENTRVKQDIYKLISRAYYHNQDYQQALQALEPLKEKNLEDERLLGFIYFTLEDYEQARDHFQKVIFSSNVESIARPYFLSLLKTKSLDKAYDLATGLFHQQADTDLLDQLARDLYTSQHYDRALRISTLIYNRTKSATSAYNAACALSRSGDPEDALKWLTKAIAAGYKDRKALLADEDLRDLHDLEGFKELLKELPPA